MTRRERQADRLAQDAAWDIDRAVALEAARMRVSSRLFELLAVMKLEEASALRCNETRAA